MIKTNQDIVPVVSNQRTKEVVYKPILNVNIGDGKTLGDFITETKQTIENLQKENTTLAVKNAKLTTEHNKVVISYKKQIKALCAQIIELQEEKKKWTHY
ncbi:MAG: hypothetical protein NC310_00265 [Roseburia sp.]|nr:hypothetical protein [Anaeroplasma bactoclasticum]MCM1195486.1 hypothetical protein [Roseburia sp.]